MNRIILAAFSVAVLASPALADDEFHCAKPGTRLQFGTYSPVEVIGQEGLTCLARGSDGKTVRMLLGMNPSSQWVDNHVEKLFPFKIGNEVEFTYSSDSSHLIGSAVTSTDRLYYRDNVKVARQERLVTKVGIFDTWVIELHEVALGRVSGSWLTTYWFAPDVGYVVKRTNQTTAGLGKDETLEIAALFTPALSPAVSSTTTPTPAPTPPAAAAPVPTASTPPASTSTKSVATTTSSKASTIPSSPTASSSPSSGSPADRLQALKDALDRKLITPAEYEAKRKAILDAM